MDNSTSLISEIFEFTYKIPDVLDLDKILLTLIRLHVKLSCYQLISLKSVDK